MVRTLSTEKVKSGMHGMYRKLITDSRLCPHQYSGSQYGQKADFSKKKGRKQMTISSLGSQP